MRLALSRSTDRSSVATDRRAVCVGARAVGTYGGQSLWKFFIKRKCLSAKSKDSKRGYDGLRREKNRVIQECERINWGSIVGFLATLKARQGCS